MYLPQKVGSQNMFALCFVQGWVLYIISYYKYFCFVSAEKHLNYATNSISRIITHF